MSRYLLGIDFAPRDLRLALVEASNNVLGTVRDQILLYCYHYDPDDGTVRRGHDQRDSRRVHRHGGGVPDFPVRQPAP